MAAFYKEREHGVQAFFDDVIGGRSSMRQNKDKCCDPYFVIVMEVILVVKLFIAVGCQGMRVNRCESEYVLE